MSETLVLETVPTGVTGWIAVVQTNFDLIEAFVNNLHSNIVTIDDQVVCHDGEVVVNF